MSKTIIYDKLSLPNCIDEITMNSKIGCILEDNIKITGKIIRNDINSIHLYNETDGKIRIQKWFIKELRVEIRENDIYLSLLVVFLEKF